MRTSIRDQFSILPDPRVQRTQLHALEDILIIALCAVICGAETWVDIAQFGRAKEAWFRTFLELPHGIPSHDTFTDIFAKLSPEQFQRGFISWVSSIVELFPGEVVAIDGLSLIHISEPTRRACRSRMPSSA